MKELKKSTRREPVSRKKNTAEKKEQTAKKSTKKNTGKEIKKENKKAKKLVKKCQCLFQWDRRHSVFRSL